MRQSGFLPALYCLRATAYCLLPAAYRLLLPPVDCAQQRLVGA